MNKYVQILILYAVADVCICYYYIAVTFLKLISLTKQCEKDYKKEFALKSVMGKMNTVFESDSVEGIMESLQKEGSDWSKKQYEIMSKLVSNLLRVNFLLNWIKI